MYKKKQCKTVSKHYTRVYIVHSTELYSFHNRCNRTKNKSKLLEKSTTELNVDKLESCNFSVVYTNRGLKLKNVYFNKFEYKTMLICTIKFKITFLKSVDF